MLNPLSRTTRRSAVLAALLVTTVVACGSDDDSDATPDAENATEDVTVDESDEAAEPATQEEAPVAETGSSVAVVTMEDGTVYEFALTTCATSNTDEFEIDDSYDLYGKTSDGASAFTLGRAGLAEDFITHVGFVEGDFDENGLNAAMLYNAALDDEPLTVDGASVSGTLTLKAIAPTRPHGDETTATLDATC